MFIILYAFFCIYFCIRLEFDEEFPIFQYRLCLFLIIFFSFLVIGNQVTYADVKVGSKSLGIPTDKPIEVPEGYSVDVFTFVVIPKFSTDDNYQYKEEEWREKRKVLSNEEFNKYFRELQKEYKAKLDRFYTVYFIRISKERFTVSLSDFNNVSNALYFGKDKYKTDILNPQNLIWHKDVDVSGNIREYQQIHDGSEIVLTDNHLSYFNIDVSWAKNKSVNLKKYYDWQGDKYYSEDYNGYFYLNDKRFSQGYFKFKIYRHFYSHNVDFTDLNGKQLTQKEFEQALFNDDQYRFLNNLTSRELGDSFNNALENDKVDSLSDYEKKKNKDTVKKNDTSNDDVLTSLRKFLLFDENYISGEFNSLKAQFPNKKLDFFRIEFQSDNAISLDVFYPHYSETRSFFDSYTEPSRGFGVYGGSPDVGFKFAKFFINSVVSLSVLIFFISHSKKWFKE